MNKKIVIIGGGLPPAGQTGKWVIQLICKKEKQQFTTNRLILTQETKSYILKYNLMKDIFAFFFLFLLSVNAYPQKREIMYLWPVKVPGELKEKQPPSVDTKNNDNIIRFSEVTNPAVEVFLPDPAIKNGSAVIVCPGGGYQILAYDLEGTEIAAWLNKLGYTAFVLQYRIPG